MKSLILSSLLLQTTLLHIPVTATRLLAVEVLTQCQQICQPIVELTKVCAIQQSSGSAPGSFPAPAQIGSAILSNTTRQNGQGNRASDSSKDGRYRQRRRENPARMYNRRDAEAEAALIEARSPTFDTWKPGKGVDCNKPNPQAQQQQQQQGSLAGTAAEKQCVCSNQSFNVVAIAGLCASCQRTYGAVIGNPMDLIMANCAFTSTVFVESVATVFINQVSVVTVTKLLGTGVTSIVVVPVRVTATQTQVQVLATTATVTETRVFTSVAVETIAMPAGGFTTTTRIVTATATQVVTQQQQFTRSLVTPPPQRATQLAVSSLRAFSPVTPSPSPTFLFATANRAGRTEVVGGGLLAAVGAVLLGLL